MVKKSLLTFFILFAAYTGLMLVRPELSFTQNQEQTNLVNAEKYLYDPQQHNAVVVGSSLTTRLVMAELPGYQNLAFSGLTALDGLNIIKHGAVLPKHIFIETNVLYKPQNTTFNDQIFAPLPFYSKKYLISLRDGKEPMGFAELVLAGLIGKIVPGIFAPYTPTVTQASRPTFQFIKTAYAQETPTEPSTPKALGIIAEEYATAPDAIALNNNLAALKDDLDYFTSQGVEIYFFETPIHADLVNSPKAATQRQLLLERFPADHYTYILPPDNSYGNDGDGIHMNTTVAKAYTIYFREHAEALMQLEAR